MMPARDLEMAPLLAVAAATCTAIPILVVLRGGTPSGAIFDFHYYMMGWLLAIT
jgi:hypothetical protein